jgi:hypothetical protein
MNRRRLVWAVLVIVWALGLAIIAKASVDRIEAPPWGNPAGERLPAGLAGSTQIGQAFAAPLPGLYRIEVGLEPGTGQGAVAWVFHLKAGPDAEEDLWTATLQASDVTADGLYVFEFPPIRESENQRYYFYLESAAAGVPVRYSPTALLAGSSAYADGQPLPGNLQFRTFYSLRTRDRVGLILSRLTEGRPYLLGTPGFYIGWGLAYVLVLVVFVLQLARAMLEEGGQGS